MIKNLLKHPLTRNLDIDDPLTTALRRKVIQEKVFLKRIYREFYECIGKDIPEGDGAILELGSGAGFLEEFITGIIKSDRYRNPYICIVLDGTELPFAKHSLRAIVMLNVLHHLPDTFGFLNEAGRCVRLNGKIIMIEPWITSWSTLVYKYLHHEICSIKVDDWRLPENKPLSIANTALPWIMFHRDSNRFHERFLNWKIESIKPMMPFRYLVSGGLSLRSMAPHWTYSTWLLLEKVVSKWIDKWAMFAQITLRKI